MEIIRDIPPIQSQNCYVAIDVELFGMNEKQLHRPTSGIFACLSICTEPGKVYFIDDEKLVSDALTAVENSIWVMHNAKFDLVQLRRWASIPPRKKIWDTLLIERILWGGYYDLFALDHLARRYLNVHLDKSLQKAWEFERSLNDELINYAVTDADITLQVCGAQKKYVTKADMEIWHKVDRPALMAVIDFLGFRLDVDKWLGLAEESKRLADEITATLPMNPRSPKQVKTHLQRMGFGRIPDTEEKTLQRWILKFPDSIAADLATKVLDSRRYAKRHSTYGKALIDNYVESEDGYSIIKADFEITGAETGRMSCVSGNTILQTNRGSFRFDEYVPQEGDLTITHTGQYKPIIRKIFKGYEPMFEVHLSSGNIIQCTNNHRILTPYGWEKVKNLVIGSEVSVRDKSGTQKVAQEIATITQITPMGTMGVWDIEVAKDHSYIAGGFINHNSSSPNFQNIPSRDTKEYRKCFIARPGNKLVIADYSAQEPRVAAHLSQDKQLLEIFHSKKDIYCGIASLMYKKDITKSDPLRHKMKTVFLGLSYGLSAYGLALEEDIAEDEAERIIRDVFHTFPEFARWAELQRRNRRYVTTAMGRKIWLNPYSSQCERNCLNAPVQGTSAEMMKMAVGKIHENWNYDFQFGIVAVIHDEIVLDVPEKSARDVGEFVRECMIDAGHYMCPTVPFTIDISVGNDWSAKN